MSAVLLSTGIAAATPSWAIQTTPNGPGATTSVLSGVSCTSSSACVAVGYYVNGSSDDVVFAEAFTTTGWTILSPVIPTGASSSELSGVSCLSATSCTAVGSYNNGTNTVALIEHWTGGVANTWVVQTTTAPTGSTYSTPTAVSVNPSTAVGYYYPKSGPTVTLAERWNGTTKIWDVQKTPNPTGSLYSVLNAVSCTSSGAACTAVGYYYNGGNTSASLAERWDGKTWALESTPTGVSNPELTRVSCSSASACTAVGFGDDSPSVTVAEQWNGKTNKWTLQSPPNPAGSAGTVLSGVSCLSATECTAVGSSEPSSGQYATLAELYS